MPSITVTITNTNPELDEETFLEIVGDAFARIVEGTPVRTGYCKSQWNLIFGGSTITLFNPCSYISFLEDDLGWVQDVIDELPGIIATATGKLRKFKNAVKASVSSPEYIPVDERE